MCSASRHHETVGVWSGVRPNRSQLSAGAYTLAHVFNEARSVLRPSGLFYIGELHPYKQVQGAQAKYRDAETRKEVLVPAFLHHISEYINTGIEAGFTLRHIGEWQKEAGADLQLLTLLFERA